MVVPSQYLTDTISASFLGMYGVVYTTAGVRNQISPILKYITNSQGHLVFSGSL